MASNGGFRSSTSYSQEATPHTSNSLVQKRSQERSSALASIGRLLLSCLSRLSSLELAGLLYPSVLLNIDIKGRSLENCRLSKSTFVLLGDVDWSYAA